MRVHFKVIFIVLVSSFLVSHCIVVSGVGSIFLNDKSESDNGMLGLLALGGASGLLGTSGTGTAVEDSPSAQGIKQWTRLLGVVTKTAIARGVVLDVSGNVYITGYTNGSLDGQALTGTQDLFVVKYNSDGGRQWTRLLGVSSKQTAGQSLILDSSGNIYVSGYTSGNLDGQTLTGNYDLILVKYNSDGVKQWTRLLGVAPSKLTWAWGITADSNGNLYLTGSTDGNLDGQTLTGSTDLFVVKYDSNGIKQWTRLLGVNPGGTGAEGITSDLNGNIYVTGTTSGNLDGQTKTGTSDLYVVKYNSNGVKQWTRLLGGNSGSALAYGICSDLNNNVYTTGKTNVSLDGQALTGTQDFFIVKYDNSGVKQWTRLLGVASVDTISDGIACDNKGNIYATGYTNGNLDSQTKIGSQDSFIVKYDANGVKQWTRLLGVASAGTIGNAITSNNSGSIYSTGYTTGNLDGQTKTGTQDLFIVKYN